jgi:hypothetical protein
MNGAYEIPLQFQKLRVFENYQVSTIFDVRIKAIIA